MKKMKLNLLEKKEMNEVRGGADQKKPGPGLPCTCMCHCVGDGVNVNTTGSSTAGAISFYSGGNAIAEPFVVKDF